MSGSLPRDTHWTTITRCHSVEISFKYFIQVSLIPLKSRHSRRYRLRGNGGFESSPDVTRAQLRQPFGRKTLSTLSRTFYFPPFYFQFFMFSPKNVDATVYLPLFPPYRNIAFRENMNGKIDVIRVFPTFKLGSSRAHFPLSIFN